MKKTILSVLAAAIVAIPSYGIVEFGYAQADKPVTTTTDKPVTTVPDKTVTTAPSPVMSTLPNPLKVKSISELFYDIVDFVISLSYVVIAFFFLLSGFKFVTAQGSDDKLGEAKKMFFNTVIGALIIVGANTIVAVVRSIIENLQK